MGRAGREVSVAVQARVQSRDPDNRATLRDVLRHRTGFPRAVIFDMNSGASSEEMIQRMSSAEASAPFRQQVPLHQPGRHKFQSAATSPIGWAGWCATGADSASHRAWRVSNLTKSFVH
jgi:CubicO group peptidase (beta-lactamase class C family)